ncbi:hypothetical protein F66182_4520 [Fusarium sp. NRRL 66182]|nr:hypothetical protein F66182_4520 [Fusarium sp. NRRL 66182]
MSLDQKIHIWLRNIQDHGDDSPATPEQKRPSNQQLPVSSPKRRRLNALTRETSRNTDSDSPRTKPERPGDDDGFRNNPQPRPGLDDGPLEAQPTSPTSWHIFPPQPKPYNHLGCGSDATEYEAYNYGMRKKDLSTVPPPLETLLSLVGSIADGYGILPSSQRQTIKRLKDAEYKDWVWAQEGCRSDMYFSDHRRTVGDTPQPGLVHRILYQAAFCDSGMVSSQEDWDTEVVHRVLEAALRGSTGPAKSELVDFRLSTTARVIPEYHRTSLHPQKVDFCVYIEPTGDREHPTVPRVIKALTKVLPYGSFNHTDLDPLRFRPVVFSVETLRQGRIPDLVRLQTGVWMPAHWEFLERLLKIRQEAADGVSRMKDKNADDALADEPDTATQAPQLPEYLLGIVVQGHEWHLIVSRRDGERTGFNDAVAFGSTTSSKGVYKIIYVLQVLQHWAKTDTSVCDVDGMVVWQVRGHTLLGGNELVGERLFQITNGSSILCKSPAVNKKDSLRFPLFERCES